MSPSKAPTGNNGVTISGPGSSGNLRLFRVASGASLTLENLTLSGGSIVGFAGGSSAERGGGGGGTAGVGGAILNQGTLAIQNSTLSGNTARGGAGGRAPPTRTAAAVAAVAASRLAAAKGPPRPAATAGRPAEPAALPLCSPTLTRGPWSAAAAAPMVRPQASGVRAPPWQAVAVAGMAAPASPAAAGGAAGLGGGGGGVAAGDDPDGIGRLGSGGPGGAFGSAGGHRNVWQAPGSRRQWRRRRRPGRRDLQPGVRHHLRLHDRRRQRVRRRRGRHRGRAGSRRRPVQPRRHRHADQQHADRQLGPAGGWHRERRRRPVGGPARARPGPDRHRDPEREHSRGHESRDRLPAGAPQRRHRDQSGGLLCDPRCDHHRDSGGVPDLADGDLHRSQRHRHRAGLQFPLAGQHEHGPDGAGRPGADFERQQPHDATRRAHQWRHHAHGERHLRNHRRGGRDSRLPEPAGGHHAD